MNGLAVMRKRCPCGMAIDPEIDFCSPTCAQLDAMFERKEAEMAVTDGLRKVSAPTLPRFDAGLDYLWDDRKVTVPEIRRRDLLALAAVIAGAAAAAAVVTVMAISVLLHGAAWLATSWGF